jgi:hypothetical protein
MELPSRRFTDLSSLEIRTCAEQGWLAVIPTGCTEQQGPHLPVDFETWFAETLMVAAAEEAAQAYAVQALVLPAMPFGPTPEHRQFRSGFIDIPRTVYGALVEAILTSLATQGFQRMVLLRGCGGMISPKSYIASMRTRWVGHRSFYPRLLSMRSGAEWQILRFQEVTPIALPPRSRSISGQTLFDGSRFRIHTPPRSTGMILISTLLATPPPAS